jgi:hypothetical protein
LELGVTVAIVGAALGATGATIGVRNIRRIRRGQKGFPEMRNRICPQFLFVDISLHWNPQCNNQGESLSAAT